jgi:hypothetical protein
MLQFKNKKKQKVSEQLEVRTQLIESIIYRCIKWQSDMAVWMQKKAQKFSHGDKLVMLIVFVIITGGYCIHLTVRSFFENQRNSFSIIPIKTPSNLSQTGDDSKIKSSIITKSEYEKIHAFTRFMDSLKHSATGKSLYDGIIAERPRLMDSIQYIEKLYQSQIKK